MLKQRDKVVNVAKKYENVMKKITNDNINQKYWNYFIKLTTVQNKRPTSSFLASSK